MNIIKRISLGTLNFFPQMMKRKSSSKLTDTIVVCLLALCLLFCFWMTSDIEPKLAFFIDGFELANPQSVTLGDESDVCFRNVQRDYLTITPNADGTFTWEVNEKYQDTLMYFKINDANPQKHIIREDESQSISVKVPGKGSEPDQLVTFTGQEIWDEWEDNFDKQHDVSLSHFVARNGFEHKSSCAEDSLYWKSLCDTRGVRSFLEKTSGGLVLVILDNKTTLTQDGNEIGYQRRGTTSCQDEEFRNRCKVQFFNVSEYCYMDGDTDNGTFQIDGVNYVMKPTVNLTEWGAGHVMLERMPDGNISVHYPKALGFVGTIDSLYSNCSKTSHYFTLKQNTHTFPVGTDIYLPQISSEIPQDLCNVQMAGGYDVYLLDSDNSADSLKVEKATTSFLPFSAVPALKQVVLHSGGVKLNCRAGFINSSFAWTYMFLPLCVAILLILLILSPWSPVRVDTDEAPRIPYYSVMQLNHYPRYFALLMMIASVYCVCKSLIALKLSYTFPYFEKLTGITPVSTSLMLLLFFTAAMVLNHRIIEALEGDRNKTMWVSATRHGMRKWCAWGIVAALFVGMTCAFFKLLDPAVSAEVIKSYFPSQIYDLNPFHWREAFGLNDTHRSVPYTLMLMEVFLLMVWFAMNCYYQWAGFAKKADMMVGKLVERLKDCWAKLQEIVASKVQQFKDSYGEQLKIFDVKYVQQPLSLLKKVHDFVRKNFIYSLIALMALIFAAFFITPVSKELTILALLWAVICLWDAVVLAVKALFPGHMLLLFTLAVVGPMLGNFGTAFISIAVILGLCKALSEVKFTANDGSADKAKKQLSGNDGVETRHIVFFEMLVISLIYIGCAMVADNGYMTNYVGILLIVICFYFIMDKRGTWVIVNEEESVRENKWVACLSVFAIVLLITLPTLCSKLFSTDDVNYSKFSRRIMLYSDFRDMQGSGYRYAESDTEFMTIMSHYMQNGKGSDPLSNEDHFLHPSISTGQSPVVLNDLSVPVAFIGSYGIFRSSAVYFMLLFSLLILVVQFSLGYESTSGYKNFLTKGMQWRLLALFMWIGTSFYIYMSYLGKLPFTGRLNPGFGVDAVGEALESALLLAFMAVITVWKKENN